MTNMNLLCQLAKRLLPIVAAVLVVEPALLDAQSAPQPPQNVRVTLEASAPSPSGSLAALQPGDLTFLGQVDTPGTQYLGQNLAMRYVGGERRFLTFQFMRPSDGSAQGNEEIGDLVEYKVIASLTNGGSHWVDANVPGWTEVRRWKHWTTIARQKSTPVASVAPWKASPSYQAGVMPAGFYWDEAHGVLWYSLLPQYSPSVTWPAWNAVKLADSEAGGDVSNGNIYGPFYFKDKTTVDLFKDAASGMTAIDTSRQAAMGGTHILEGHHSANIGDRGARSIGLWVVNGLPDPSTLSPGAVLWPGAYHLYDTSPSSGKSAPNVRKPNISKNAYYHGGNDSMDWQSRGGVASAAGGTAVGLAVNDAIYTTEEPYVYIDTVTVYMDAGASGGDWAPEIYNGSAWVEPTGWKISVGDTALSQPENVFYWPKVAYNYSAAADAASPIHTGEGYRYVRLRRKHTGTSGGTLAAMFGTISMVNKSYSTTDILPLPGTGYVGSYIRPGSGTPQYDASHYGYQFVDPMYGGAWVRTSNVEGLAYFGAIAGGGYVYGPMPVYAQPEIGGTPIKYESANLPAVNGEFNGIGWTNGPRWESNTKPYFLPFNPSDLLAAAGDSSKRFSDFLNPASYTDLYSKFPGLISQYTVTNPRITSEPYYGEPRIVQYFVGASTIFDSMTNQLIVMIPTYNAKNILAFFQVR